MEPSDEEDDKPIGGSSVADKAFVHTGAGPGSRASMEPPKISFKRSGGFEDDGSPLKGHHLHRVLQLLDQRAWRPHSLRRSEHEPKECAGSLLRRGRAPNVAFESNMQ